jgi:hypothetical protein
MRGHSSHARFYSGKDALNSGHMPPVPEQKESGLKTYKITGICYTCGHYEKVDVRVESPSPPTEIGKLFDYSPYTATLTSHGTLDGNVVAALVKDELRGRLREGALMQVIAGNGLPMLKKEPVAKPVEPAREPERESESDRYWRRRRELEI